MLFCNSWSAFNRYQCEQWVVHQLHKPNDAHHDARRCKMRDQYDIIHVKSHLLDDPWSGLMHKTIRSSIRSPRDAFRYADAHGYAGGEHAMRRSH